MREQQTENSSSAISMKINYCQLTTKY